VEAVAEAAELWEEELVRPAASQCLAAWECQVAALGEREFLEETAIPQAERLEEWVG
jgi:hypothetical protein